MGKIKNAYKHFMSKNVKRKDYFGRKCVDIRIRLKFMSNKVGVVVYT
jgi:hypothetical protein